MALVDKTLETAILSVFNSMSSMTSGGDAYCAKNMANAIKTYILIYCICFIGTLIFGKTPLKYLFY